MPTAFHHALHRGDHRTAAEWLVRHHATAVLALCEGYVQDTALAEDLCQDAFARAFGGLAGFREEAEPRTWLLVIARNRCLDELRRQGRSPVDGGEPIDEAPDERPLEEYLLGDRQAVQHALAGLGEGDRALVLLRFVHGLGYPELADSFGLKQGTVRMRVSRALARMRLQLEPPIVMNLCVEEAMDTVEGPAAPPAASRTARRRMNLFRRSAPAVAPPPPPPTMGTALAISLPPSLRVRLEVLVQRQKA